MEDHVVNRIEGESYLVGEGPELFELLPYRWDWIVVDTENGEPLDAPRFLLNSVPEDLRSEVYGEFGEKSMRSIIGAGVERVKWRQAPRHIEWDLISEDVFTAIHELLPGSVSSLGTLRLGWGKDQPYHVFKFHLFPTADLLGETDDRDPILFAECDPPITLGEHGQVHRSIRDAVFEARKAGLPVPVLALASWLARDNKIIDTGTSPLCVTDEFVRRWRATDVSKMLWADNYEHDFFFRPWTYGSRHYGGIPYKWVDVPN